MTQLDLKILNQALKKLDGLLLKTGHSQKVTFVVCGGAALIAQNITNRRTQDLDVIDPVIEKEILESAKKVAADLDLNEKWLNDGPRGLIGHLPKDWRDFLETIFSGQVITIKSLGRRDLLISKLWAQCDRGQDFFDLVALKPTEAEINLARDIVKELDSNPDWPGHVEIEASKLKQKLGLI